MAFCIEYKEQFVWVSNQRARLLISFALEVGAKTTSDKETSYVRELNNRWHALQELRIEVEFPDRDERKFWARVFYDVAYLVFHRKLGHQDAEFWQPSAIGDAYILARMLTRSVQEEELGWNPETRASHEAEEFFKDKMNVTV